MFISNRLQISLAILSEFKQINSLPPEIIRKSIGFPMISVGIEVI